MIGRKKKVQAQVNEKKFDEAGLEILGKLPDAEYWKWRLTIEEMEHSKSQLALATANCQVKTLEIEKMKYQLMELNRKRIDSGEALKNSKQEYDKVKTEIEKAVGISLAGCVVDPYTFEVKRLEEKKQSTGGIENGAS